MREILFRGKRVTSDNKWVTGYYDGTYQHGIIHGHWYDRIDPETLCEFTGLYDRNGARVFEGDIVRADNGHIGYVAFRNGSFVKRCSCHKLSINTLYGNNETVIGNIYDNPELLEEVENNGEIH